MKLDAKAMQDLRKSVNLSRAKISEIMGIKPTTYIGFELRRDMEQDLLYVIPYQCIVRLRQWLIENEEQLLIDITRLPFIESEIKK